MKRTLQPMNSKTLVTAAIGLDRQTSDTRTPGNALEAAGYNVVPLSAFSPPADFVNAAVETNADGILVYSLHGHGEPECRGFREICVEAGIGEILAYFIGIPDDLTDDWRAVEERFLTMGFDRAFPSGTGANDIASALECDFLARAGGIPQDHP